MLNRYRITANTNELMNGFNDLKNKANESKSTNNQEYEDLPYVNIKPDVAIAFDAITDMRFFGEITDDDGNPTEIAPRTWYEGSPVPGDLIITVENPTTIEGQGQLYEASGRAETVARNDDSVDEYIDYYLLDPDADGFGELTDADGNTQISPNDNTSKNYSGEQVDGFSDDEVTVFIRGKSAYDVARALDVNGSPVTPVDKDGNRTNGLLEANEDYDRDVDNAYRRVARYPQLRELEWDENDGGFLFHYTDGQGYEVDLYYNDFEDSVADATEIEPTFNPEAPEYDSVYFWHEQPPTSNDSSLDLGNVETNGAGDSWKDDLSAVEVEFVQSYVEQTSLNPDREPVHAHYGGNWEKWDDTLKKNFAGDVDVTMDVAESLNDACKAHATEARGV